MLELGAFVQDEHGRTQSKFIQLIMLLTLQLMVLWHMPRHAAHILLGNGQSFGRDLISCILHSSMNIHICYFTLESIVLTSMLASRLNWYIHVCSELAVSLILSCRPCSLA